MVYFSALKEKNLNEYAITSVELVNYRAGMLGYSRIDIPATRTDTARNAISKAFMQVSKDPNDVLVMLDYDHRHPPEIIERLVAHELPVVGALAFRRGMPYFPCVFFRDTDGVLRQPKQWEPKLYKCDALGTAAIAIRRSVFETLEGKGLAWPWFRYTYPDGPVHPSEDMYFSRACEMSQIPVYCDMGLITPHLTVGTIDEQAWYNYLHFNPDGGEMKGKLLEMAPKERMI